MDSKDVAVLGRRMVADALLAQGAISNDSSEGRRPVLRVRGRGRDLIVRVSTRRGGDWQTSIAYLGADTSYWRPLRNLLSAADRDLHHRLVDLGRRAGIGDDISAIRVWDIVCWMHARKSGI